MANCELTEQLGVRDRCTYFLVDDEPQYGRWWAVQLVALTPPGEMFATTPDGAPVEHAAVAAAERREDGLWQWLNMTPAAKRVFGELLIDQKIPHGTWAYVVEVDQKIIEMAEMAAFDDDEEEVESP